MTASINNTHHKIARFLLLVGLLSLSFYAAAVENPYEKNYFKQNTADLQSFVANPQTKMFISNHKDEDNIPMLESGYDLMGFSEFEAGDVAPDLALAHAKAIKADTVLVYVKYGAEKSAASKLQAIRDAAKTTGEIDEKALKDEGTQYRYYASYWAKLPTPLLGVHIIQLKPIKSELDAGAEASVSAGDEKSIPTDNGLTILAVIKDSPAAKAHLLRGDVLQKIGDIALEKPEALYAAVKQYQGQTVDIAYERAGQAAMTKAALNKR